MISKFYSFIFCYYSPSNRLRDGWSSYVYVFGRPRHRHGLLQDWYCLPQLLQSARPISPQNPHGQCVSCCRYTSQIHLILVGFALFLARWCVCWETSLVSKAFGVDHTLLAQA